MSKLDAGLHQAEQDVTGLLACLTDGSAGDLALGDEGADVVFGAVGVEWNLGTIENAQEFMLAAMQPGQQAVERDVACSALNRRSKRARSAAALRGQGSAW
jgi:hypothetical protein